MTEEYGKTFARLLSENSLRLTMRQADVADASGIPRDTIDRWEAGLVRNPRPEQVQAVCEVLGIDYRDVAAGFGIDA